MYCAVLRSWLAMKFHKQAIYIETLRDLYESYVLYSFLQFLIQVLGGEQALILMLKDKSPTRGVHMWGLQWCVKPWLMGQPVRRTQDDRQLRRRVHWTSPFFVQCKFGVLQYVLLKFVSAVAVMILELKGWYREGNFSPKGGYLYICILTNTSQCWALYCLIFFYYATHNELSPIRPVGKFLSVKALVFFTWWQSVIIAILYQMDMIPHYQSGNSAWTQEDVAKGIQDYLICIEMFFAAIVHVFVFPHNEYTPQAVEARARAWNQTPMKWHKKRLGRKFNGYGWEESSKSSRYDLEMATLGSDTSSFHETWEMDWVAASSSPPRGSGYMTSSTASQYEGLDRTPTSNNTGSSMQFAQAPASLALPHLASAPPSSGNANMTTNGLEPVQDVDQEDDTEMDVEVDGECEEYDEDEAEYEDMTGRDEEDEEDAAMYTETNVERPGFVRALLDSAIPRDLRDNTVGIVKGDYAVEKKTLLYHAAASDQYDLFSARRPLWRKSED
jgi:Organic solute transporter Ostalpha